MFEAVLEGTSAEGIDDVEVLTGAALATGAAEVLGADGYILGTPANLGYMSGAMKHFFDTIYYPCLAETRARPFAMFVHGNSDTEGAVASIRKATTGLGWTEVQSPVQVVGEPSREDLDACWELGASCAAGLTL